MLNGEFSTKSCVSPYGFIYIRKFSKFTRKNKQQNADMNVLYIFEFSSVRLTRKPQAGYVKTLFIAIRCPESHAVIVSHENNEMISGSIFWRGDVWKELGLNNILLNGKLNMNSEKQDGISNKLYFWQKRFILKFACERKRNLYRHEWIWNCLRFLIENCKKLLFILSVKTYVKCKTWTGHNSSIWISRFGERCHL